MLTMIDLVTTQTMSARPPPTKQLMNAFTKLIASKIDSREPVTYMEADHLLRTFRHFRDTNKEDPNFGLSVSQLRDLRQIIGDLPKGDRTDLHNELAKELFEEISKRSKKLDPDANMGGHIMRLVGVLTQTGDSIEARGHVERYWSSPQSQTKLKEATNQWALLFRGFALEENEEELLRTFRLAELAKVPFTPYMRQILVVFYANKNDVVATKAWHNKKVDIIPSMTDMKGVYRKKEYTAILEHCIRNNEIDWCTSVFKTLIDANPDKDLWDIIFQWAASAMGKGVEELDRMMTVMVARNPDKPTTRPDAETINGLIRMAISRNDSYAAERYIDLGKKWGIQPNAATFILQMNYRIDAKDLTGAQASYDKLRGVEIEKNEDVPVINKYIQALCKAKTVNHDLINGIVSDLEERKQLLTGDTVTEICLMNLRRNELHDAVNVLQTNSYHHSIPERDKTQKALTEFCYDRSLGTQLVWDAYNILRHLFDEIDTPTRTRMMNEFFHRQKPNLATHVFGHMRQHPRSSKRPLLSTYVAVFSGFALPGCADRECLDTVYNMLKLDSTVEPNTQLRNSLMLAYTALDEPAKAIEFWEDITNSSEGPTYASIEIVFGACEKLPFGDRPAKSIWTKMRRMEIEVTSAVYSAYVGALAGQGLDTESRELVEGMEADIGVGPDMMTYVSSLTLCPPQHSPLFSTFFFFPFSYVLHIPSAQQIKLTTGKK